MKMRLPYKQNKLGYNDYGFLIILRDSQSRESKLFLQDQLEYKYQMY